MLRGSHNAKNTKKANNATTPSLSNPSLERPAPSVGGAAVSPPPGGLQSAAPPLVVRSVLDQKVKILPNMLPQVLVKSFLQYGLFKMLSEPLFFSPQEHGGHRNPAPKFGNFRQVRHFFRFFGLLKRCSKFASEKHAKKCEN